MFGSRVPKPLSRTEKQAASSAKGWRCAAVFRSATGPRSPPRELRQDDAAAGGRQLAGDDTHDPAARLAVERRLTTRHPHRQSVSAITRTP